MYRFHAAIHRLPLDHQRCDPIELDGRRCEPLWMSPAAMGAPLETTFEAAGEALTSLERMFFEPDGSFVWVSAPGEPNWQVDGVLYDRGGRLLYAEIKGSCPAAAFDQLLAAFGWPKVPLMFQLLRQAVYLDEAGFRCWAGGTLGSSPGHD